MIKKLLAVLAAVSVTVSALPVFADETDENIIDTIITADDASFETAVEALGEIDEIVADNETDDEAELFSDNVSLQSFEFNEGYDEVKINNDFNTETNTGAPDGSNYKISDGTYCAFNGINFDSNYYVSMDFKFTNDTQKLQMRNKTDGGNYGATLMYKDGKLINSVSSEKTVMDNFLLNEWYKLELEGRMRVTGAVTYISIYKYNTDGTATQVLEPTPLDCRNFASGNNSCKFIIVSEGVSIDNEYGAAEWADKVEISQENNITEIDAGNSLQFSATASRNDSTDNFTQPSIIWIVADVTEENKNYITISDEGKLNIAALAAAQTVKVVAMAASNGNPYAEYEVQINAVNLSNEKFDTIVINGTDNIAAGTTETYTYTASKEGQDITDTLTENDVIWSIYDSTGNRVLGNKYITVNNGTLTVDKSVIGQTISLRASTSDGLVYSDKLVTVITDATEDIIKFDACENKVEDNKALVQQGSWDGSSYYVKNTTDDFLTSGTLGNNSSGGDILISMDLKFMSATGAGITTIRRDGGAGLWLCSHSGILAVQTGGSDYTDLTSGGQTYPLDANSWYHIDLMFNTAGSSLNIWKYDESGEKVDKATFTSDDGLKFRSTQGFNRMKLNGDTGLDNYKVAYPDPTELEITGDTETMGAGSTAQFGIAGSRDGLKMPGISMSAVNWAVYDSEDSLPIEGNDVTITAGLLSSYGLTSPQTVYVRAISTKDKTVYASKAVSITASNQFEITNIGYDSENDRQLVKIFANKLTDYKDDAVFIMTFFNSDGKLIGSYAKKVNAKNLKTGANEIVIDYTLPESYDKETGKAKIMAWTSLTTTEEPEGISGQFAALYSNGTVTLNNLPAVSGKVTIAVYNSGVKDSDLTGDTSAKIVYASQSESAINSISLSNLPAGEYTVAVGGIEVNGEYSVYRAAFTLE